MRHLVGLALVLGLVAGAPAAQAQAPAPPEIALTIEQHKFTPEEIKVKAGQPFVLVITNKDATPEEFESKELRVEKVVPGNKTAEGPDGRPQARDVQVLRRVPRGDRQGQDRRGIGRHMGGTFVITLREGFEAALILGLIYTYLEKIGARREFRYVTVGALLGVAASLALGVLVTVLSGPLVDLGPDLIGAVVLFAASGMLTWHGWWMRQHARAVRGELERRIDAAQARSSSGSSASSRSPASSAKAPRPCSSCGDY